MNFILATILVVGALVFTPLWRSSNPLVPADSKAALGDSTPDQAGRLPQNGKRTRADLQLYGVGGLS